MPRVASGSLRLVTTAKPGSPPNVTGPESAAPSVVARVVAAVAIGLAGICGGLVGYAVTDLQCSDGCTALAGSLGLLGAVLAALGVGIVAILALRAMAEWRTGQLQQAARDQYPVN